MKLKKKHAWWLLTFPVSWAVKIALGGRIIAALAGGSPETIPVKTDYAPVPDTMEVSDYAMTRLRQAEGCIEDGDFYSSIRDWKRASEYYRKGLGIYSEIAHNLPGTEYEKIAQEAADTVYLDPILQETREKGEIYRIAKRSIRVKKVLNPSYYSDGNEHHGDCVLKVDVYEDGELVDLKPRNWFSSSRKLDLSMRDYSLKEIMGDLYPENPQAEAYMTDPISRAKPFDYRLL